MTTSLGILYDRQWTPKWQGSFVVLLSSRGSMKTFIDLVVFVGASATVCWVCSIKTMRLNAALVENASVNNLKSISKKVSGCIRWQTFDHSSWILPSLHIVVDIPPLNPYRHIHRHHHRRLPRRSAMDIYKLVPWWSLSLMASAMSKTNVSIWQLTVDSCKCIRTRYDWRLSEAQRPSHQPIEKS